MEFVRLDGMARDEFNCCIAIIGIRISIGDLRPRGVRGVYWMIQPIFNMFHGTCWMHSLGDFGVMDQ